MKLLKHFWNVGVKLDTEEMQAWDLRTLKSISKPIYCHIHNYTIFNCAPGLLLQPDYCIVLLTIPSLKMSGKIAGNICEEELKKDGEMNACSLAAPTIIAQN